MEKDQYKLTSEAGPLKGHFSRNQFEVTTEKLLPESLATAGGNEISLRSAVIGTSKCGGQGFKKCNCGPGPGQCKSNRCKCVKAGIKCNSRCHGSGSCRNK